MRRFITWLSKLKAMVLYVMDSSPYQYEQILSNMDFNAGPSSSLWGLDSEPFLTPCRNLHIYIHPDGQQMRQLVQLLSKTSSP